MNYACTITIPDNQVLKAIEAELLSTKRSTSTIAGSAITVEAQDATALRAALATITRLLVVYEKTP